jgi:hypothetical protein
MAEVSQANVAAAGWRLKLGVALFGLSIALPVLGVPLVAATALSAATAATFPVPCSWVQNCLGSLP